MATTSEEYLIGKIMRLMPPPAMMMEAEMNPDIVKDLQNKLLRQGPQLIKKISKINPSGCSDQFKLTAAQFFIQYYTIRMFELAPKDMDPANMNANDAAAAQIDPDKLEAFKADQARDMEFAWKLLTSPIRSPEMSQTAKLLMIELGQRLEDSVKLTEALKQLDSLISNLGDLTPAAIMRDPARMMQMQLVVVAFTAAPLVGQFEKFIRLGDLLPPQELERFSMVSQNMPVPDYSILYKLAKEENAAQLPIPDPKNLPWNEFYIESIRVKFRDLDCENFTDKRQELLDEINSSEENIKWEPVPNPNNIHLKRMGAIYQCVSFAEAPQQLCGIYREDRIKVQGKTQAVLGPPDVDPADIMAGRVQVDPSQLQVLVQEECWDLVRSETDPNFFTGTYEMHNYTPTERGEKITDPEKAPLHMTFDLEIKFCTLEEHAKLVLEADKKNAEMPEIQIEKVVTDFDDLELD